MITAQQIVDEYSLSENALECVQELLDKDLSAIQNITDLSEENIKLAVFCMSQRVTALDRDFRIDGYRFIAKSDIDEIMTQELGYDTYLLGSFTASFISDILDIETEAIADAQRKDCYELLGQMMLKEIDIVQEQYVKWDGYGHWFAHYDGEEHELSKYYIFKI